MADYKSYQTLPFSIVSARLLQLITQLLSAINQILHWLRMPYKTLFCEKSVLLCISTPLKERVTDS